MTNKQKRCVLKKDMFCAKRTTVKMSKKCFALIDMIALIMVSLSLIHINVNKNKNLVAMLLESTVLPYNGPIDVYLYSQSGKNHLPSIKEKSRGGKNKIQTLFIRL